MPFSVRGLRSLSGEVTLNLRPKGTNQEKAEKTHFQKPNCICKDSEAAETLTLVSNCTKVMVATECGKGAREKIGGRTWRESQRLVHVRPHSR
jgi:hypothetical protein